MSTFNPPTGVLRFERVRVADVVVGDRLREVDEEHVERLMTSFEEFGLQLQPIVLNADRVLIDGAHRLAAARELGWESIDVGFAPDGVSEQQRLFLEAEANAARKEMTLTERKRLWETIFKPRLAEQAAARKKSGQMRSADQTIDIPVVSGAANFPEPETTGAGGEVRDQARQFVQVSTDTLRKVDQLEGWRDDAALPEQIQQAAGAGLARADQTGRVDGEFKHVAALVQQHTVALSADPADKEAAADERALSRAIEELTLTAQRVGRIEVSRVASAIRAQPTSREEWSSAAHALTQLVEFVDAVSAQVAAA